MADESTGERIRRLRRNRGLTLAEVAGSDFSRAFLSQVEIGRSRPSTRVLRIIAARLDTQIDYLIEGPGSRLELEVAVERARLLVAIGRPAEGLRLAAPAIGEARGLGADARLCVAEALIALGRVAEAGAILDAEEARLARRGDAVRGERLASLRAGRPPRLGRATLARHGDRELRAGRLEAALECYRAARAVAEAAPRRPPGGPAGHLA